MHLRRRLQGLLRPKQTPPPFPLRDIGERLQIGRHSYGSHGSPRVRQFEGDRPVRAIVGNFCSMAEGVEFMMGGNHPLDRVSTYPFAPRWDGMQDTGHTFSRGDIVIGSDVYIGRDAKILSGVTIGHGAVIGAYSIVAKDVPPYTVMAGNPARALRRRFDDATCDRLLSVGWWDWPDERIREFQPLLTGTDMARFLDAAEQLTARRGSITDR